MIKVLCVGAAASVKELEKAVKKIFPDATVECETDAEAACYMAERRCYDVVLTDTKWDKGDGLTFARYVHDVAEQTRIIFVTKRSEYAVPAFKTRAQGYLLYPLSLKDLIEEFNDLGIGVNKEVRRRVEAKTFGNFDLLCDGKSVKFSRSKSKELVAYLIDRCGTAASSSELIVNLWEDKDVDRTTRSMLHNLISDVKKAFAELGISYVLDFKHNSFRIDDKAIICDYYDLLDGKTKGDRFTGEYMANYPWAEMTAGTLAEMTGRY